MLSFAPVTRPVYVTDAREDRVWVGTRESRVIDRFCDYSYVSCVILSCARRRQSNGKHKIHQTCQCDAYVYFRFGLRPDLKMVLLTWSLPLTQRLQGTKGREEEKPNGPRGRWNARKARGRRSEMGKGLSIKIGERLRVFYPYCTCDTNLLSVSLLYPGCRRAGAFLSPYTAYRM